ncbi:sperm-specific protein Don juan-like [Drosophila gunungcola]|uniref:sperm-specific protein Don juan-like n=1 Tax=Drosophila gunungcola TaxID=103775 RepID=UPI0022E6FA00|nr:sperm-specific protein Don juan-like [Drosophila gunungcola]
MFKMSAVILGRSIQTTFKRSQHLKVLVNLKKKDICKPDSFSIDKPTKFKNGSIGVIRIQENERSLLANPMQRQFLDDLKHQQAQRIGSNGWLEKEKDEYLKKIKREYQKLDKEITMSGGDSDLKDSCKEIVQKEKLKKEEIKKKCRELAAREKCEKDKLKKKCKKMNKKDKCKKKDPCPKDPCPQDPCLKDPCPEDPCAKKPKKKDPCEKKDPCKKKDPCEKKKVDMKKICKELAEMEQCKNLAEKEKMRKMLKNCKKMAEEQKCKKMAEKEKCRKKALKANKDKCRKN